MPAGVAAEVRARPGRDDEAVSALATMVWLRAAPAVVVPPSVIGWDLDPGESEVIALAARTPDATAVLDDRVAPRAQRHGPCREPGGTASRPADERLAALVAAWDPLVERGRAALVQTAEALAHA